MNAASVGDKFGVLLKRLSHSFPERMITMKTDFRNSGSTSCPLSKAIPRSAMLMNYL